MAIRRGWGSNCFAIMADGLGIMVFEIVTLENDGVFKLLKIEEDDLGKKVKENQENIDFRKAGFDYNQDLSGRQVINNLKGMF